MISYDVLLQTCFPIDIGIIYPGFDGDGGNYGRFYDAIMISYGRPSVTPVNEDEATALIIANLVCLLIYELFPSSAYHPIQVVLDHKRYILEPVFALAFTICSLICSVRVDVDVHRKYFISQGVREVFKYVILCGETFLPVPLMVGDGIMPTESDTNSCCVNNKWRCNKDELFLITVHGPSGGDFDVVFPDSILSNLKEMDRLRFDWMGDYTLSIVVRNCSLPIRYVYY